MRLWSLSPSLLDTKGLVALWREALLAKAVLEGKTKGYKHHSQLDRFKSHSDPIAAINFYLEQVYRESLSRGYSFDSTKFSPHSAAKIQVTDKQLQYEFNHLLKKLFIRDLEKYHAIKDKDLIVHDLFETMPGEIADWEIINS